MKYGIINSESEECEMFQILVIEDDKDLRELFCRTLRKNSYQPFSANDAQEALTAAQDKLYRRFSKMETAMSKINSNSSSLSSFFGGG